MKEFLIGIDDYISEKIFDEKGRIGEEECVSDLLRSLNGKGKGPRGLVITAKEFENLLQEIISEIGLQGKVKFCMETEDFSKTFEGAVNQADYALALKFVDTSSDVTMAENNSWEIYYLFQTKVARIPGEESERDNLEWSDKASFVETSGQVERINMLKEIIGDSAIYYHYFCPYGAIGLNEESHVYRKLKNDLSDPVFNECERLGMWITEKWHKKISGIFSNNDFVSSWVYFILMHYFDSANRKNISFTHPLEFKKSRDGQRQIDERNKILKRDKDTLEKIITHLGTNGTEKRKITAESFQKRGYLRLIEVQVDFPSYEYELALSPSPPAPDEPNAPGGGGSSSPSP